MENNVTYNRYSRQIMLKELGIAGQEKLSVAKVLVIGAGGLGCPALQYLAAAGVGSIGIVDFDVVELSNLQRQTLFNVEDIGKSKSITAAEKLKRFNPDIQFHAHDLKLDSRNALGLFREYDMVLDGTDNFTTRYLVNDACVLLDKPLVYGAVLRFEGQVGVFNLSCRHEGYKTNYRDLFPVPPSPDTVSSCSEAGVLGVLPGVIGTMQAAEVIKIITGIGEPLCNKILSYNVRNNMFYEFNISLAAGKSDEYPKSEAAFMEFDYDWFCGHGRNPLEISVPEFEESRKSEVLNVIDVREEGELPQIIEFTFIQIPLSRFDISTVQPLILEKLIVLCQSGKRSLKATKMIKEKFPNSEVFSLKGGVEEWMKYRTRQHNESKPLPEYERDEETRRIC